MLRKTAIKCNKWQKISIDHMFSFGIFIAVYNWITKKERNPY